MRVVAPTFTYADRRAVDTRDAVERHAERFPVDRIRQRPARLPDQPVLRPARRQTNVELRTVAVRAMIAARRRRRVLQFGGSQSSRRCSCIAIGVVRMLIPQPRASCSDSISRSRWTDVLVAGVARCSVPAGRPHFIASFDSYSRATGRS
jgi:hypothetical protein